MKLPSLNLMSWLPANEIAVDLGTANTLVYVKGEGIVLNEPSVVAIEKATGKIKGIGLEAKRMLGRTPDGILAVRPLKDGVIADFDVTEKMLRYFLKTIIDKHVFRVKPKVIVCVPSGITEVERRAVRDSAETAGAKQVLMVAEPMAAAIGVGLPVETPTGNRKGPAPKRPIDMDPVYGSQLVSQLVSKVLQDGKKQVAQRIVYTALEGCRDQDRHRPGA